MKKYAYMTPHEEDLVYFELLKTEFDEHNSSCLSNPIMVALFNFLCHSNTKEYNFEHFRKMKDLYELLDEDSEFFESKIVICIENFIYAIYGNYHLINDIKNQNLTLCHTLSQPLLLTA
jgi:hypothetical protein